MTELTPQELADIDPAHTVHIAVHVQNCFFNPGSPRPSEERRQPQVTETARRIAATSAQLSGAGVPTYWVRMENEDISKRGAALYLCKKRKGDKDIADSEQSAIASGNVLELLRKAGAKTLLISGGYASICVTETVKDALPEGFKVIVLKDCLVDNQEDMNLRDMFSVRAAQNRAKSTTSNAVLEQLGATAKPQPKAAAPQPALS